MSTVAEKTYTPEDLLSMPDRKDYELVDGHLERREMSVLSSWVNVEVLFGIRLHLREDPIGWVWGPDLGYTCYPDAPGKVRKPDVSFIRKERLPEGPTSDGYQSLAPDLAVEVVSPNDLSYDVEAKVVEYLEAGVKLVWIIDPEARTVRVHRPDRTVSWLREGDELSGEDVLPGFCCPVSSIFPKRPAAEQKPAG